MTEPTVAPAEGIAFGAEAEVVIVGGGAAGMVAALAAAEAGAEPVVVERDAVPRGSTALSAGLIPAAGTRWQRAAGIADDAARFAADIQRKAKGEADEAVLAAVTRTIAGTLEWLADSHGLAFSVVTDFLYPGHSAHRMHGLASRSGAELIDRLRSAVERAGIAVATEAAARTLFVAGDGTVRGIGIARPDGSGERIGCRALVLACNGYGGNRALVRRHIPELAEAVWFGHDGNRGEAVLWGEALGAELRHLSGHQGHGSVAHPHGILITWAVIMQGGVQVNALGERFSDETEGYSEQAARVLAQPGGIAWDVFDARIAAIARQFEDFRAAEAAGAVLRADSLEALAAAMKVPPSALAASLAERGAPDRFGRDWTGVAPLAPPYCAVRVTGALFHTQGGLAIRDDARVRRAAGGVFPNLFAAGGAAAGLSGSRAAGYLSGNGLLTAVALGAIAGSESARLSRAS
ncbi:FAD-binding protein [Elioraea sp. Yellowstone]|jgi:fumarate reductase flavoprotein subunit|uniref:FAD-dependent oxidoreductase n=1 Tax=Elioraea sp. Yellowstone TaxID=2592070 RepID=UPI00115146EC|nr:FAD-dependent oxidoreductase [Elioraea sp. Yellowstone]TQF82796.1 FAD-binding protein [Elioraea sp. Yellowstone]